MSFTKPLIRLQFKIDRLGLPQRIAVLCSLLFIVLVPWFFLVHNPQIHSAENIQKQINDLNNQTIALQRNHENILMLAKSQDIVKLTDLYLDLEHQMQTIKQEITHFHHNYIDDKELSKLLYSLLHKIEKLEIINFSTVVRVKATPPVPIKGTAATPASKIQTTPVPDTAHYSLSLRGDYFSIMQFLEYVERLKWQLFWDKLDYTVIQYPVAIATIEFYTLKPESAPLPPAPAVGGKK